MIAENRLGGIGVGCPLLRKVLGSCRMWATGGFRVAIGSIG